MCFELETNQCSRENRYRFEKFSLNAASILEAAMLTGDFWS
jgi:hypothetical protein